MTQPTAIWTEIQMTGALRLFSDAAIRSAIVNHFIDRTSLVNTIDQNFRPAGRALRALAWDVMPVESFGKYMTTRQSEVPASVVLDRLKAKDESEFLLKRLIITATVARINLQRLDRNNAELLEILQRSRD